MHLAKGSHTPDKVDGSLVAVNDKLEGALGNLTFLRVLAGVSHLEVIKPTTPSQSASES